MAVVKPKKKTVRRRKLTGIKGAPMDSFVKCKDYFHFEVERKEIVALVKDYVRKDFSKDDAKSILANPEYTLYMFAFHAATIHWMNNGLEFEGKYAEYRDKCRPYFEGLIDRGNQIIEDKKGDPEETKTPVVRLNPKQLMQNKFNATLAVELDDLEEDWISGKKSTIDLYARFKKHDLKPAFVPFARQIVEFWLLEYSDAYDKKCEQAMEAHEHVKRTELKRRIKVCLDMLADLDRIVQAGKAQRKTRAPKPKTADKQIATLKYQKEDRDLKVVSINPATIIGAGRLLVLNTKTRTLTEYVTDRRDGFEIKGTTLQGFDFDKGRTKTLRKPQEFIPIALKKTVRQFDKLFEALTTKETKPTGRINADCILLRADK